MHLKPNCVKQYTETLENEIIPMLRSQKGFQDEISFVNRTGTEATGISIWNTKEDAEAYERTTYKKVITALADVIKGAPEVRSGEVTNSTTHAFKRQG
jgi:heme-degrading monooxygenase HmoA